MDVLILAAEICELEPLPSVMSAFNSFYMKESAAGKTCIAQGQLRDLNSGFGPALELYDKNGRRMEVRIPWRYILAVVSGESSDVIQWGFTAPAK